VTALEPLEVLMAIKDSFVAFCAHTLYEPAVGPNSVVLDLGANHGEFSRTLSVRYGRTCAALEPTPSLYERIDESPRLRKYQYAMWSESRQMEFHLSGNSESSSFLKLPDGEDGEKFVVPTMSLETFVRLHGVPTVDILKVVVEGAEIAIFNSLSDDYLEPVKQISIEFHDSNGLVERPQIEALRSRLMRLGFVVCNFALRSHFDMLFLNQRVQRTRRLSRWRLMLAPFYLKLLQCFGRPRMPPTPCKDEASPRPPQHGTPRPAISQT
jgi:FkbM family methyltransferase